MLSLAQRREVARGGVCCLLATVIMAAIIPSELPHQQKKESHLLDDLPIKHIKASSGWVSINWQELWHYRELLYFLTWRDIKVRYKQTVLGAAWAIIQPLFTMVVFSVIFGQLAGLDSDGVPYPIFNYAALVPWTFFANGLRHTSDSLVDQAGLIKKVYFPRLLLPIAPLLSGMVDMALAFSVLLIMLLFYGMMPTHNIIWLSFFLLLAFITALGVGLWFAAINVKYRDVRFTIPFLTQFWLFATPIAYSSNLIPEQWRVLYGLNPMVGVVEGFRWALVGTNTPSFPMLALSAMAAVLILVGGLYYFRRMEKTFADVI